MTNTYTSVKQLTTDDYVESGELLKNKNIEDDPHDALSIIFYHVDVNEFAACVIGAFFVSTRGLFHV